MAQHFGDHQPETVYSPERYASDLHGRGRTFVLQSPLGVPAVRMFTDDRERLGYMQVGDHREAIDLALSLNQALVQAKAAGARTSDVFDYWAQRATPTLGAGPVTVGDLELLSPTPGDTP
jgi:hypothetical protein